MLDEQGAQSHAEVFVGLSETQTAQFQLTLGSVDLARELVDGAAECGGEMLAESRHDTPQHVIVKNTDRQRDREKSRWRENKVKMIKLMI